MQLLLQALLNTRDLARHTFRPKDEARLMGLEHTPDQKKNIVRRGPMGRGRMPAPPPFASEKGERERLVRGDVICQLALSVGIAACAK